MRNDRLRRDSDEIRNLEDIITAHGKHTSHVSEDTDSLEEDLEIPEEIDVDHALTFPHPRHTHGGERIELMDTPDKSEVESEWMDGEMQPSDYEQHYDDAIDQFATDDLDAVVEGKVHDMSEVNMDELGDEETVEVMPSKFSPSDEEKDRG